jgi:hypothetical protein
MATRERNEMPAGVAMVAYFAIIVGIVQLVVGVVLLFARDDLSGYTSSQALMYAIALLIVGMVYLAVGRGLMKLQL